MKRSGAGKRGKTAGGVTSNSATPYNATMRSSYHNQTTAASSNMYGAVGNSGSGSGGGHRHMMTFGDIKTSSFPKADQRQEFSGNMTSTPLTMKSVDNASWVEVQ